MPDPPRPDRIVIVGAGLAALRCAERLRELGHTGTITVIGDEDHRPYNRPPLSKQLLAGKVGPQSLRLRTFTDPDVTWRLGEAVVALNPADRTVSLASGAGIPYDGLVLATGVEARTLDGAPSDPRILTLRHLADCRRLDAAFSKAQHVAIIGGGFIGGEVATSARQRGLRVTIIDVSTTLLGHAVGAEVGGFVTDIHRRAGVGLRLGTHVVGFDTSGPRLRLDLADDGPTVVADIAVVGVGTRPCVAWLGGHGLDLSDGVLCDPTSRVVGLDDTVAAGDCARWPNLRYDRQPRRVEHWINAVEHGRHAAHSLLAPPARRAAFTPLPRFWSEQHGAKIQSTGMPRLADSVDILESRPRLGELLARYRRDGHPVAYLAVNQPRALLRLERELVTGRPDDNRDLAASRTGAGL